MFTDAYQPAYFMFLEYFKNVVIELLVADLAEYEILLAYFLLKEYFYNGVIELLVTPRTLEQVGKNDCFLSLCLLLRKEVQRNFQ